jgi:hypothetical protein
VWREWLRDGGNGGGQNPKSILYTRRQKTGHAEPVGPRPFRRRAL